MEWALHPLLNHWFLDRAWYEKPLGFADIFAKLGVVSKVLQTTVFSLEGAPYRAVNSCLISALLESHREDMLWGIYGALVPMGQQCEPVLLSLLPRVCCLGLQCTVS